MLRSDIFKYENSREILCVLFEEKRRKNPRFSIRAWSKLLGYENPSLLAQIFKGDRSVSVDIAKRVAKASSLSAIESRYLETLALRERAKGQAEIESCGNALEQLRRKKTPRKLAVDRFRLIADWYHLAILELMSLKGFRSDPEWISKRLGGKISVSTVRIALQRLERLGLIETTENGFVRRKDPAPLVIDPNIRNLAIQAYHEQMISKAIEPLKEQDVAEREFRGSTLSIKKENYKKAQTLIRDFHQSMVELAEDADADETYHLSVQFFKLTHPTQEGGKI